MTAPCSGDFLLYGVDDYLVLLYLEVLLHKSAQQYNNRSEMYSPPVRLCVKGAAPLSAKFSRLHTATASYGWLSQDGDRGNEWVLGCRVRATSAAADARTAPVQMYTGTAVRTEM